MKKTLKRITICLLISTAALQATAVQFTDGNTLFSKLRGEQSEPVWAMAYIVGINDAMTYDVRKGAEGFDCFSTPKGVSAKQLSDIVSQWLDRNPQQRHFSAASLVRGALASAYPCR